MAAAHGYDEDSSDNGESEEEHFNDEEVQSRLVRFLLLEFLDSKRICTKSGM